MHVRRDSLEDASNLNSWSETIRAYARRRGPMERSATGEAWTASQPIYARLAFSSMVALERSTACEAYRSTVPIARHWPDPDPYYKVPAPVDVWNVEDDETSGDLCIALRSAMGTLVLSGSPLHTGDMRRRILEVLRSDNPEITPAARAAAASALNDPTSLSDSAISHLSEALTHMAGHLGYVPEEAESGRSSS